MIGKKARVTKIKLRALVLQGVVDYRRMSIIHSPLQNSLIFMKFEIREFEKNCRINLGPI
jgi:hypothetical protein